MRRKKELEKEHLILWIHFYYPYHLYKFLIIQPFSNSTYKGYPYHLTSKFCNSPKNNSTRPTHCLSSDAQRVQTTTIAMLLKLHSHVTLDNYLSRCLRTYLNCVAWRVDLQREHLNQDFWKGTPSAERSSIAYIVFSHALHFCCVPVNDIVFWLSSSLHTKTKPCLHIRTRTQRQTPSVHQAFLTYRHWQCLAVCIKSRYSNKMKQ